MQTKKCINCGKAIPDDAITCKHCGTLFFSSEADISPTVDEESEPSDITFNSNVLASDFPEKHNEEFFRNFHINEDNENYGDYEDNDYSDDENYEDDSYGDTVSARYRKTVIIVLSILFLLLVVLVILLFASKDNLSDIGKKNGAAYNNSINYGYLNSSEDENDAVTDFGSSEDEDEYDSEDEDEDDDSLDEDEDDSDDDDEDSEDDDSDDDDDDSSTAQTSLPSENLVTSTSKTTTASKTTAAQSSTTTSTTTQQKTTTTTTTQKPVTTSPPATTTELPQPSATETLAPPITDQNDGE
jgi:hypothetical protein